MASIETLPTTVSTSATAEQIAAMRIEQASLRAEKVGDLQNEVREEIDVLAGTATPEQAEAAEDLGQISLEKREEVVELMEKHETGLEEASQGIEDVTLSDELEDGVLGETKIGTPSAAKVRRELALDPTELERTGKHERSITVGHASHVAPEVPNPEIALIHDGEKHAVTPVFEGYVERGVSIEMGEGPDGKRPGQPEKTYREGQDLANHMVEEVGEGTFNHALRVSGNYGEIQGALWKRQLAANSSMANVLRIVGEAKETGYEKEAAEAFQGMAA